MVRPPAPLSLPFLHLVRVVRAPLVQTRNWLALPSGTLAGEPLTPGLPGDVQPSPAGAPRPGRLGFSDNIRIPPGNADSVPGALEFL